MDIILDTYIYTYIQLFIFIFIHTYMLIRQVLWNEQGFLDVVAGSDYPAVARSAWDFLSPLESLSPLMLCDWRFHIRIITNMDTYLHMYVGI